MEQVEELIKKLNNMLSVSGSPLVSPTSPEGVTSSSRGTLFITPDLNIEKLSNNELLYAHVLLHKLYSSKSKTLNKTQIIELHNNIKDKINHSDFDELDRNDKR